MIGVLTAIVVLVVVNTIVTDRDTEPAKADGGRFFDLPGGDLQVRATVPYDPPIVLIHGWAASSDWLTGSHRCSPRATTSSAWTCSATAARQSRAMATRWRSRLTASRSRSTGSASQGARRRPLDRRRGRDSARRPPSGAARRLAIIDTEPDEKYVPTDTLGDLSVTP